MICPSCQTPHAEPVPRFCDACGLALPRVRRAATAPTGADAEVRCAECGVVAHSRRCSGCGARVRWPEGVIPPDELEGRPLPPALELHEDEDAPALELDDGTGTGTGEDR